MTEPEADRPVVSGWGWGSIDGSSPAQQDAAPVDAGAFGVPECERYDEGGELGRGGMGVVHASFDRRLGRIVARKQVAAAGLDPQARARLQREAAITARLDHPGVVPVFDAGVDERGEPFYTMRLVAGRTLAEAIAEQPELDGRLRLLSRLLAAAYAVAYAHDKGVLHRDLKPANILLGAFGETQVVDWGLARTFGDGSDPAEADDVDVESPLGGGTPDAADAHLTRVGAVVGTPGYLSPEAALGAPSTPRSDVFSLGVSLAEVVAGRPLYANSSAEDMLDATRRGAVPDLATLESAAPAELVAIVRRATARDPADRYADAGAFASDLQAFVDGRVVGAYRYSAWDQVRRIARAWRAPLVVGGIALAVLVVALSVAFQRTAAERDRAVEAEQAAHSARARADRDLGRALLEAARTAHAAEQLPEAEILAAHAYQKRPDPDALGILMRARTQRVEHVAGPVAIPTDCIWRQLAGDGHSMICGRMDETVLYELPAQETPRMRWRLPRPSEDAQIGRRRVGLTLGIDEMALVDVQTGAIRSRPLATRGLGRWIVDDAGEHLARFAVDAVVRLDGDDRATKLTTACGAAGVVAVALAPDRGPIAGGYALICDTGEVERHDAAGLPLDVTRIGIDASHRGASAAWWSADGETLVVGSHDGTLGAYDVRTLRPLYELAAAVGQVRQIRGNGHLVAVAGEHGGVEVRVLRTGVVLARLPASAGRDIAFDADGVLTTLGETLHRWKLDPTSVPLRLPAGARRHGLAAAAFHPDGGAIAVGRGDGMVVMSRLSDGEPLIHTAIGRVVVKSLAFDSAGHALDTITASAGSRARFLDDDGWHRVPLPRAMAGRRIAVLASGRRLVAPYGRGVRVYDDDARLLHESAWPDSDPKVQHAPRDLDIAPDRRVFAAVDGVGNAYWGADEIPLRLHRLGQFAGAEVVAVAPDGKRFAVGSPGHVVVVDRSGEVVVSTETRGGRIHDIAWSPDGAWLALGELPGTARLLDADTLRTVALLRGHQQRVAVVRFQPGGRRLATASWDGSVALWDLPTVRLDAETLRRQAEMRWALPLDTVLEGKAARALR